MSNRMIEALRALGTMEFIERTGHAAEELRQMGEAMNTYATLPHDQAEIDAMYLLAHRAMDPERKLTQATFVERIQNAGRSGYAILVEEGGDHVVYNYLSILDAPSNTQLVRSIKLTGIPAQAIRSAPQGLPFSIPTAYSQQLKAEKATADVLAAASEANK